MWFVAGGCAIIRLLLPRRRMLSRLYLGVSLGVLLMLWLPALWAYALRFTAQAHWAAAATVPLLVGLCWLLRDKAPAAHWSKADARMLVTLLCVAAPLTLLSGYLQYTHTLRPTADGALHVGQSTYGDLSLHLAVASSAVNAPFPLQNSLMRYATMAYPYLSDTFAASFMVFGMPISAAMVLTGTLMMALVYAGYALLCGQLIRRRYGVALCVLLLFLNGGLGFFYTLSGTVNETTGAVTTVLDNLREVFTGFYKTPTNQPNPNNLRWSNILCDMLLPQRGILGGWTLLLPALNLLLPPLCERARRRPYPARHGKTMAQTATDATAALLVFYSYAAERPAGLPIEPFAEAQVDLSADSAADCAASAAEPPIEPFAETRGDLPATDSTADCAASAAEPPIEPFVETQVDLSADSAADCAVAASAALPVARPEWPGGVRSWILCGVFAGALPLLHTHSFLALALLSLGLCLYMAATAPRGTRLREMAPFALYAAVTGALALPQLIGFTFVQATGSSHFLTFQFNWCNNRGGNGLVDPYLWFYLKNIGVPFVLIGLSWFVRDRQTRLLLCGAFCIYLVAELIRFQPNEYDNNKLFYVWFLAALPGATELACAGFERLRGFRGRGAVAALFLTMCFLSSALTVGRECVSDYQAYNAQDVAVAEYVRENTPEHAVFLTGTQHLNPVASLAGRDIVLGADIYLYYHGFDTGARKAEVWAFYENPAAHLDFLRKYGVQYIYVSPWELSAEYATVNLDALDALFPLEYSDASGQYRVYRVTESALEGRAGEATPHG